MHIRDECRTLGRLEIIVGSLAENPYLGLGRFIILLKRPPPLPPFYL